MDQSLFAARAVQLNAHVTLQENGRWRVVTTMVLDDFSSARPVTDTYADLTLVEAEQVVCSTLGLMF